MTKNQNQRLFILPMCVGVGGGGGRAGQGRAGLMELSAGVWKLLFSYVTQCFSLIHITLYFNQGIP